MQRHVRPMEETVRTFLHTVEKTQLDLDRVKVQAAPHAPLQITIDEGTISLVAQLHENVRGTAHCNCTADAHRLNARCVQTGFCIAIARMSDACTARVAEEVQLCSCAPYTVNRKQTASRRCGCPPDHTLVGKLTDR